MFWYFYDNKTKRSLTNWKPIFLSFKMYFFNNIVPTVPEIIHFVLKYFILKNQQTLKTKFALIPQKENIPAPSIWLERSSSYSFFWSPYLSFSFSFLLLIFSYNKWCTFNLFNIYKIELIEWLNDWHRCRWLTGCSL